MADKCVNVNEKQIEMETKVEGDGMVRLKGRFEMTGIKGKPGNLADISEVQKMLGTGAEVRGREDPGMKETLKVNIKKVLGKKIWCESGKQRNQGAGVEREGRRKSPLHSKGRVEDRRSWKCSDGKVERRRRKSEGGDMGETGQDEDPQGSKETENIRKVVPGSRRRNPLHNNGERPGNASAPGKDQREKKRETGILGDTAQVKQVENDDGEGPTRGDAPGGRNWRNPKRCKEYQKPQTKAGPRGGSGGREELGGEGFDQAEEIKNYQKWKSGR